MPMYRSQREVRPTILAVSLTAYSISDVVGGLLTFEVANAAGSGVINWLRLVDDAAQSEPCVLYLFNDVPTIIADNAAFAVAVSDLKQCFAKVPVAVGDYVTISDGEFDNNFAIKTDLGISFVAGTGRIYGYLVTGGAPSYLATTDLDLTLGIWMDAG